SGALHPSCPRVVVASFRCFQSEAAEFGCDALAWAWSASAAIADGMPEIFSALCLDETNEEELSEKDRREPRNMGQVWVRQGEDHNRANGTEGGDRENEVGNAKRFEFDCPAAFVLGFRTREYCEREVKHGLEQDHEKGCGDERSEHRSGEKMLGSKE